MRRLLAVSALIALGGAAGCLSGERMAAEASAPGALPPGWRIDRRSNDLVYEANGFRFPVAVAGSLRDAAPAPTTSGAGIQVVTLQKPHGMLQLPVGEIHVTELGFRTVGYHGPDARYHSLVAFRPIAVGEAADFVPRETAAAIAGFLHEVPDARVERVAASPLPFGERATRGCRADLRWTTDAGEPRAQLVLAAAGLGHVVLVATVYDPSPSESGDPHTEAWQRSTALLRLFEPPPEARARLSQEQRTPPALAGTCAAPAP